MTLDLSDFDECLHGAVRKIGRAESLADSVKSMCRAASKENAPLELDYEQLNEGREHIWRIREDVECDPDLPMVFGDAVHNFRTALDHLAWSLVGLTQFKPSNTTYFPVCEVEPTGGREIIRLDRRMDSADPINVFVQSVQPFVTYMDAGPSSPIAQLHRLDLADKHRVLLISVVGLDYGTYVNADPDARDHAASYAGPIAAGSIVMRAYTTTSADLSEGRARLTVRLEDPYCRVDGEGNEIRNAPPFRLDVVDFLEAVHPEVVDIVRGANAFFQARHVHADSGFVVQSQRDDDPPAGYPILSR